MPKIPAGSSPASRGPGPRGAAPAAAPKAEKRPRGRASVKALTQFTTQLSTLQDAGLPIVRSLKILEGQMDRGPLKSTLVDVTEDVESGSALSDALAKHPESFDGLYTNMVKAGEAGGVLDVILSRLAGFMDKAQKLRKRVRGAMVYPAVVLFVTVSILLLIMIFVVPKFEEVFKQIPGIGELPAITRSLQSISRFLVERWYVLLIGIVLLVVGYRAFKMSAPGRRFFDRVKLRLPIVGRLTRKIVVARFSRTLGTLIASGVPILEALTICRNTAGNVVLEEALEKVHASVREGESIAEPLGECGIFDDIVVNMIDVGEETGELDKMLMKVADNYDDEVDVEVSSLVSVIEPLLILFMGGAVFVIVLGLFLPLMKLIQGVGQGLGAK
ncbi:MAG: type II secretion system F family protein [Planctomycetes bacterium]|nr:type II secretion system F family protein [Planctomycetota bacterium]